MERERIGIFEGGPPEVYVGSYGTRACLRADREAALHKTVLVRRYRKRGKAGFVVDAILTRYDFDGDAVLDEIVRWWERRNVRDLRFGPCGDTSIEVWGIAPMLADGMLDVVLDACQRTRRPACAPRPTPALQSA